jgi:hypothetical protein
MFWDREFQNMHLAPQDADFSRGLHHLLGAQCWGLVLGDKETILGQV